MTAHQVSHTLPFGQHSCFHAFLCNSNTQDLIQQEGERANALLSSALLRHACPHSRHTHPVLLKICFQKKPLYMHKVGQFTQPQLPCAHMLNYRCTILVSGLAEKLEALLSRVLHQSSAQQPSADEHPSLLPSHRRVPSPLQGVLYPLLCSVCTLTTPQDPRMWLVL